MLGWTGRNETDSEASIIDDVKDSPVVVLDICAMDANTVSGLISRFMAELKMKVEFRIVEQSYQKRPDM